MPYERDGGDYPVKTMAEMEIEELFDSDEYIQWLIDTGRVPDLIEG